LIQEKGGGEDGKAGFGWLKKVQEQDAEEHSARIIAAFDNGLFFAFKAALTSFKSH
jgi:hypothetical protein